MKLAPMKLGNVALFACAVALSLPSVASAVVIEGTTTGGPTYTRVLADLSGLSSVGVGLHYQVTAFSVGTAGSYDFTSNALYDNFLTLYSSFDPLHPLLNVLNVNDDLGTIGISGFSQGLAIGTSYFAVATSFSPGHFGAYTLTITGPGTVNLGMSTGAVPEPAAWMMMIAGFGLVGSAMRRRGNFMARSAA